MILAEAVEDLARAQGWWSPVHGLRRWRLSPHEGGYRLIDWSTKEPSIWQLTAIEAMLVLRCALLGPTRDRCPDCAGEKVETRLAEETWSRAPGFAVLWAEEHERAGWRVVWETFEHPDLGERRRWRATRPCPTCSGPAVDCEACDGTSIDPENPGGQNASWANPYGDPPEQCLCDGGTIPGEPTGYLTTEQGWAERWLRARPTKHPRDGGRRFTIKPGDPEARKLLTVLADELLGKGDPLGLWLSLWLAGAPCGACDGKGEKERGTEWIRAHNEAEAERKAADLKAFGGSPGIRFEPVWNGKHEVNLIRHVRCEPCHGFGLELGHHTAAMAEAGRALAEDLARAELK